MILIQRRCTPALSPKERVSRRPVVGKAHALETSEAHFATPSPFLPTMFGAWNKSSANLK